METHIPTTPTEWSVTDVTLVLGNKKYLSLAFPFFSSLFLPFLLLQTEAACIWHGYRATSLYCIHWESFLSIPFLKKICVCKGLSPYVLENSAGNELVGASYLWCLQLRLLHVNNTNNLTEKKEQMNWIIRENKELGPCNVFTGNSIISVICTSCD